MSRIGNASQNAQKCWEYVQHFNPAKINKTTPQAKVGVVFVYGDFLYLYSHEEACILKQRYGDLTSSYQKAFQKILTKDPHIIQEAFSYKVWNQFYVESRNILSELARLRKVYDNDLTFQKYLQEDFNKLETGERVFDDNQINFFLEEHLVFYLWSKGQLQFENNFTQGKEKWILTCYPGKPLKAHVYLHQQNFFKLHNPQNKYENSWYDLENKILYDYDRVNLETLDL